MCAFRFQRFSLYLTLYAFALCEIYQAFAVVYKKNLYKIFFKVVFRPYLPGLLATAACQTRTFCVIFAPS